MPVKLLSANHQILSEPTLEMITSLELHRETTVMNWSEQNQCSCVSNMPCININAKVPDAYTSKPDTDNQHIYTPVYST